MGNWRSLAISLGLMLLAAIVFSIWPVSTPVVSGGTDSANPEAPLKPEPILPRAEARDASGPPPMIATGAPTAPSPAAAPPPSNDVGALDPEPDWQHLEALGLTPDDLEPLDGGVLHPVTKDGIKEAVQQELPQIRECYEEWLKQNPNLAGKMKVQFTIMEIPGRDRAKIQKVEVADGGLGHLMMEGCVRNVFKGMRFETPRGGETRVTYPLNFENTPTPK
jgi:hypothetical protein